MLAGFRSRQPWHMQAVLRMVAFWGARNKICFRPEQSAAGGGGGVAGMGSGSIVGGHHARVSGWRERDGWWGRLQDTAGCIHHIYIYIYIYIYKTVSEFNRVHIRGGFSCFLLLQTPCHELSHPPQLN
jgi:hypothetical protein